MKILNGKLHQTINPGTKERRQRKKIDSEN